MALNRLRFHNILVREMDAPSPAASELAEVVDEGIAAATGDLVTKRNMTTEMNQPRLEMQLMFRDEINRLLKWGVGSGVAIGSAVISLLVALVLQGG